jgi:membrane-bound lytic murein transglycosylase D
MGFAMSASHGADGTATQMDALIDGALEAGAELFDRVVPPEVKREYHFPSRREWDQFWNSINGILQSGSIDELAEVQPRVRDALGVMDAVPAMRGRSDWLRSRVDYFDAAREQTQRARKAELLRRFPIKSWPDPDVPESKPPPRPHVPAPVSSTQEAYWRERLSGRPYPTRASKLLPALKREFREAGVPEELVWIAEVESSFNPAAKSPAGARGLFQLMPATARRFGVRTSPSDQRTDPVQSARAAATYLKILHGTFGSWELALAAYNAGEGRVGRALKRTGASTFEDVASVLPCETQMYVPRVLATIALREGRELTGAHPAR